MNELKTAKPETADSKKSECVATNIDETTLSEKRLKQHQQWMRVMMDGQSTPDNRYQKATDN